MRIAIVMPIWMQNNIEILHSTKRAISSVKSRDLIKFFVVCTRLHLVTPEELQRELSSCTNFELEVLHTPNLERSVAGAWNYGIERAICNNFKHFVIMANDIECNENTIDILSDWIDLDLDLISGISINGRDKIDPKVVSDGADFSCVMTKLRTIEKFGFFDEKYKPAYFEDNDMYARVVLGGGRCRVFHRSQFFHHGSLTIRLEPEAKHHVDHWFRTNEERYKSKWGYLPPPTNEQDLLNKCCKNPWNNGDYPLFFNGE